MNKMQISFQTCRISAKRKACKWNQLLLTRSFYFISCSVSSNSGLSKNSRTVISKPSQIFLMDTTPGFWLFWLSILYMVDGETPEIFARALTAMCLSRHCSKMRCATASFVLIAFSFAIYRNSILQKCAINRVGYITIIKNSCYNLRYIPQRRLLCFQFIRFAFSGIVR